MLVQRPAGSGAAGALAHKGARNIFPTRQAQVAAAAPPRQHARAVPRAGRRGVNHQGEVTTVQRNGVVTFIVLNATVASYPKLKDEYAAFVKSFTQAKAPKK